MGRSLKFDGEFYYWEIESNEVANLDQVQAIKETLQKILQMWVNQANPKFKSTNGDVGNHIETPKKGSGICKDCGCKIDPRYKSCFKCYSKHKQ